MNEPERQIWDLIREANKKWMAGRPEDVATLFHPDVVMASPQGQPPCLSVPNRYRTRVILMKPPQD